jgi:tetratricopeptide (TPR) repeat protein
VTAAQRYRLDRSTDWRTLLRHFELGSGFAFLVLLVPDEDGARVCRAALEQRLRERGQTIVEIPAQTPEQLEHFTLPLLDLRPGPEAGAVWVGHVVEEGAPDAAAWTEAWRLGVSRLNQFRNPLRRAFAIPLIFAGAPKLQVTLRENAPDLWSVRTLVAWVEPASVESRVEWQLLTPERPAYRPDPELAMEEVARLRQTGGSDPELARVLHRAGLGYAAQYRWGDAAAAFQEALELRRRAGAPPQDIAGTSYELGLVLRWLTRYEDAVGCVSEAKALFHDAGDVLGEANSIQALGSIALRRSDNGGARRRYEEALPLYRRVGSVLGEADSIVSLGDIALRQSDHTEARRRYEEALPLLREAGSLRGEAICIARLGEIALYRSEDEEAQRRFAQALPLFRQVGDAQGEANCIQRFGTIASQRSDHAEAQKQYTAALSLYEQVGDVLGKANCLLQLGDIERERPDYDKARSRYEEALPLYQQFGSVRGEANCILGLGEIAAAQSRNEEARHRYRAALALYEGIEDPYSIGWAHQRLAQIEPEPERARHVAAAREAWTRIDRPDLVKQMDEEFPAH